MIVDDNRAIGEVVRAIFKGTFYEVAALPDAEQARGFLTANSHRVAVLLLDWILPGESGLDFLNYVKSQSNFRFLPVIMLTGKSDPSDIQAGIDSGALYYVTKPFDPRILKTLTETAITHFKPAQAIPSFEQTPLRMLSEAEYKFKTLKEAETLAISLASMCPDPEAARLGLHELLVNAVEHGNLEITHEEKSRLLDDSLLQKEIEDRLQSATYGSRSASVNVKSREGKIEFHIVDQGCGFNFEKYLSLSADRAFATHGRGIAIARELCFDTMQYFSPGNQVKVIIAQKESAA